MEKSGTKRGRDFTRTLIASGADVGILLDTRAKQIAYLRFPAGVRRYTPGQILIRGKKLDKHDLIENLLTLYKI